MLLPFRPSKETIRALAVPVGLFLLNIALKSTYLTGRSIAGDEPFSIYHAQLGLGEIISQLSKGNNPPLFEMMLHFWIQAFGISSLSTRFLPMLFGASTVVFVYWIGKRFFNPSIAIAASLLFSVSNYHYFYAYETRVYTFFALMSTISMFSFFSLLKSPNNRKHIVLLTLSNIILVYSHFFGLFIPFIQLFSCLILKELRIIRKTYWLSSGILFLAYLPYIKVLCVRFCASASTGTWVAPAQFSDLFLILRSFLNAPLVVYIALILFFSALIKLIFRRFSGFGIYHKLVFIWFILPYSLMFLVSWKHSPHPVPMFFDRYMIFMTMALYLIICIAADLLAKGFKTKLGLMALIIAVAAFSFKPSAAEGREIEYAIDKVKQYQTKNSIVYLSPGWFVYNFTYYFDKKVFQHNLITGKGDPEMILGSALEKEKVFPVYERDEVDTLNLKKFDRVILIDAGCEYEEVDNKLCDFFKQRLVEKQVYMEGTDIYKVYVYEQKPEQAK